MNVPLTDSLVSSFEKQRYSVSSYEKYVDNSGLYYEEEIGSFEANSDGVDNLHSIFSAAENKLKNLAISEIKENSKEVAETVFEDGAGYADEAAELLEALPSQIKDIKNKTETTYEATRTAGKVVSNPVKKSYELVKVSTEKIKEQRIENKNLAPEERNKAAEKLAKFKNQTQQYQLKRNPKAKIQNQQKKQRKHQKRRKVINPSVVKQKLKHILYVASVGIAALFIFLTIVIAMLASIASWWEDQQSANALEGNERECYLLLKNKGFDELAIAAIMGNFYCESHCNPEQVQIGFGYDLDNDNNGILDRDEQKNYPNELIDNAKAGYGLAQWTSVGRSRGLVDFAKQRNKNSGNMSVQIDYFFYEYTEVFHLTVEQFNNSEDLEEATVWFHNFYEQSNDSYEKLQDRVESAKRIYSAIRSKGQDYANASERGKAIVDAAMKVKSLSYYDCGRWVGWCAGWCSTVYQEAGYGYIGGNANDMIRIHCHSQDKNELEVGMIIGSCSTSYSPIYGHVGIYIGDNKVMHDGDESAGGIATDTLDDYISIKCAGGAVYWGWGC